MTAIPGRPPLTVVIVSWESGPDLAECIRSLAAARAAGDASPELIVVDNGSAGFAPKAIGEIWSDVRTILNAANRGFGPAANQGVAAAHGDVVLLLNPDTRALGTPLTPLLAAFAGHPDAVAIAPRLVGGEPAPSHGLSVHQLRRLPTLGHVARQMLLFDRVFPRNRWFARDRYLERDQGQSFEVEQPAAAALAVRRESFLRVGGFDERFAPAWFEDVDLCVRLRREGPILYWPESRFAHVGAVAAAALGYDRFLPIYYRNAIRFWRKHHGASATLACRALVATGMLLRLAVLPFTPTPATKRTAARAFARVLVGPAGLGGLFLVKERPESDD